MLDENNTFAALRAPAIIAQAPAGLPMFQPGDGGRTDVPPPGRLGYIRDNDSQAPDISLCLELGGEIIIFPPE